MCIHDTQLMTCGLTRLPVSVPVLSKQTTSAEAPCCRTSGNTSSIPCLVSLLHSARHPKVSTEKLSAVQPQHQCSMPSTCIQCRLRQCCRPGRPLHAGLLSSDCLASTSQDQASFTQQLVHASTHRRNAGTGCKGSLGCTYS